MQSKARFLCVSSISLDTTPWLRQALFWHNVTQLLQLPPPSRWSWGQINCKTSMRLPNLLFFHFYLEPAPPFSKREWECFARWRWTLKSFKLWGLYPASFCICIFMTVLGSNDNFQFSSSIIEFRSIPLIDWSWSVVWFIAWKQKIYNNIFMDLYTPPTVIQPL